MGMEDIESLNVPLPGKGESDFQQPIKVLDLHFFSFYFSWEQNTVGFGELSGKVHKNGETATVDSEGMGKEWVRRALHAAIDAYIEKLPDNPPRG